MQCDYNDDIQLRTNVFQSSLASYPQRNIIVNEVIIFLQNLLHLAIKKVTYLLFLTTIKF